MIIDVDSHYLSACVAMTYWAHRLVDISRTAPETLDAKFAEMIEDLQQYMDMPETAEFISGRTTVYEPLLDKQLVRGIQAALRLTGLARFGENA